MTYFESVIRDECGDVVLYCKDYTQQQIDEILVTHEEYYLSTVSWVEDDFGNIWD